MFKSDLKNKQNKSLSIKYPRLFTAPYFSVGFLKLPSLITPPSSITASTPLPRISAPLVTNDKKLEINARVTNRSWTYSMLLPWATKICLQFKPVYWLSKIQIWNKHVRQTFEVTVYCKIVHSPLFFCGIFETFTLWLNYCQLSL